MVTVLDSNSIPVNMRPLVSVLLPAYNEEALLADHVEQIAQYLSSIEDRYRWELIIINDGSADNTGQIADSISESDSRIRVLHHPSNFGLGQVLRFGFANSKGQYIVTLDVDLSYDVQHIEELIERIHTSSAKIVLASPYMQGGSIRNVPWDRKILSILGNGFLRFFARGKYSTLTSMVRVYDGPFIRSLDLRSMGMDIMPEMLYKADIVRARIEEMPARLDWGPQKRYKATRSSSMRIVYHIISTIFSGFLFRPFLFFVAPGLIIALFALYVDFWMFKHFFDTLEGLRQSDTTVSYSQALAAAYNSHPHTFITGLFATMLSIQLVGMGTLALQNARYFEDLYHLNSTELRKLKQMIKTENNE